MIRPTNFGSVKWVQASLLIIPVYLSAAGCAPGRGAPVAQEQAPREDGLSIDTVSAFHRRLNALAAEHLLEARYQGSLAVTGRALEMRGASQGMLSWSIARWVQSKQDEPKRVLFEVSIAPSGNREGTLTAIVAGTRPSVLAVSGDHASVDVPRAYLSGLSIRSFLSKLQQGHWKGASPED